MLFCAAITFAAAGQAHASVVLFDDFDPGVGAGNFSSIIGGAALGNGEGGFLDGNALWFGRIPGSRSVTTSALNVANGGTIDFNFRGGNEDVDGRIYWENAEFPNEWVNLAYSTDGGSTFNDFLTLSTQANIGQDPTVWDSFSVEIPTAAWSSSTQFRWAQTFNHGPSTDHWALDNVTISGVPEPSSLALLGLGVFGPIIARRRRRTTTDRIGTD
jgi:hypothetical protein